MYIINLFLCCVCFVIIWHVCVTTVFSFLNVYNKQNKKILAQCGLIFGIINALLH